MDSRIEKWINNAAAIVAGLDQVAGVPLDSGVTPDWFKRRYAFASDAYSWAEPKSCRDVVFRMEQLWVMDAEDICA